MMNKKFKLFLVLVSFDVLVSVFFVFSNLLVWDSLNGNLTLNDWGPFESNSVPQTLVNGTLEVVGTFTGKINYPFILFWIAIIGNLIIFVFSLKSGKS